MSGGDRRIIVARKPEGWIPLMQEWKVPINIGKAITATGRRKGIRVREHKPTKEPKMRLK